MTDEVEIRVPGSKSMTQRALVVASLAEGRSVLAGACVCEDSLLLKSALEGMGVEVEVGEEEWEVRSGGEPAAPKEPLFLGNAGTAVRFLGALSTLVRGEMILDGNEAMRRRPQKELLDALRDLGVEVRCLSAGDRLPVSLKGPADSAAGSVRVSASVSSQHVSGLLMASPRLPLGMDIEIAGEVVSHPYIEMTLEVMRSFGVDVRREGARFEVAPGRYLPTEIAIEGDASSAAVMLAAGLISGKRVKILNLPTGSIQGDAIFPEILDRLSSPGDVSIDMGDTPDLVPPAVAVALFRDARTAFEGASHLRAKESDRIGVLCGELRKIGAQISETAGGMTIRPAPLAGPAALDPHGDHRMAMTFALVGLKVPGISILNKGCVAKSYPGFFEAMEGFR